MYLKIFPIHCKLESCLVCVFFRHIFERLSAAEIMFNFFLLITIEVELVFFINIFFAKVQIENYERDTQYKITVVAFSVAF